MAVAPTFFPGQKITASDLNQLSTMVNALTAPGWNSYTPTWSSTGTTPSVGNGVLTAAFCIANDNLILVRIDLQWGSTTSNGTGIFQWSLPFGATASAVNTTVGSGWILNATDIRYPLTCYVNSTTTVSAMSGPFANTSTTINSRGGDVSATSPFVPGTSDRLALTIAYEPA